MNDIDSDQNRQTPRPSTSRSSSLRPGGLRSASRDRAAAGLHGHCQRQVRAGGCASSWVNGAAPAVRITTTGRSRRHREARAPTCRGWCGFWRRYAGGARGRQPPAVRSSPSTGTATRTRATSSSQGDAGTARRSHTASSPPRRASSPREGQYPVKPYDMPAGHVHRCAPYDAERERERRAVQARQQAGSPSADRPPQPPAEAAVNATRPVWARSTAPAPQRRPSTWAQHRRTEPVRHRPRPRESRPSSSECDATLGTHHEARRRRSAEESRRRRAAPSPASSSTAVRGAAPPSRVGDLGPWWRGRTT